MHKDLQVLGMDKVQADCDGPDEFGADPLPEVEEPSASTPLPLVVLACVAASLIAAMFLRSQIGG